MGTMKGAQQTGIPLTLHPSYLPEPSTAESQGPSSSICLGQNQGCRRQGMGIGGRTPCFQNAYLSGPAVRLACLCRLPRLERRCPQPILSACPRDLETQGESDHSGPLGPSKPPLPQPTMVRGLPRSPSFPTHPTPSCHFPVSKS
uniref:Uncharacterized protein n=1 Tax=Cebus imitator TaxID=2715852 RepID=A0A2K5R097_CEBIM